MSTSNPSRSEGASQLSIYGNRLFVESARKMAQAIFGRCGQCQETDASDGAANETPLAVVTFQKGNQPPSSLLLETSIALPEFVFRLAAFDESDVIENVAFYSAGKLLEQQPAPANDRTTTVPVAAMVAEEELGNACTCTHLTDVAKAHLKEAYSLLGSSLDAGSWKWRIEADRSFEHYELIKGLLSVGEQRSLEDLQQQLRQELEELQGQLCKEELDESDTDF
jgi:hypothetical protein